LLLHKNKKKKKGTRKKIGKKKNKDFLKEEK
jgi:hypothetical protein